MEQDKKSGNNGYELRKAAGLYWLLDLRQGGEHYKPPLAMNEMDWRLRRTAYLGDCGVYAFGPCRFPMLIGTALRLFIARASSANPPFYCWMRVCNPGQTSRSPHGRGD